MKTTKGRAEVGELCLVPSVFLFSCCSRRIADLEEEVRRLSSAAPPRGQRGPPQTGDFGAGQLPSPATSLLRAVQGSTRIQYEGSSVQMARPGDQAPAAVSESFNDRSGARLDRSLESVNLNSDQVDDLFNV